MDNSNASFGAQIRCLTGDAAARKACRATCTVNTCPLMLSYWGYRPSIPINGAFAAIFSIFLIVALAQGIWTRRFKKYTAVMFVGNGMEVIGYVARIYAYNYPFSDVSLATHSMFVWTTLTNTLALIHHTADVPHSCPCLLRGRHLLLPLENRPRVWRPELPHSSQVNSQNIHHLRCDLSHSPGWWWGACSLVRTT